MTLRTGNVDRKDNKRNETRRRSTQPRVLTQDMRGLDAIGIGGAIRYVLCLI